MKLLFLLFLSFLMVMPVSAVDIAPPQVPEAGSKLMPGNRETFLDGLTEMVMDLLPLIRPDIAEAVKICAGIIASVLFVSVLQTASDGIKRISELSGILCIAVLVLRSTHSLIRLGSETIQELTEYEKLLLPVLTSAVAAQGGISTATALYTGTALFNMLLSSILSNFLLPLIYLFQVLSICGNAFEEQMLGRIKDSFKKAVFWVIKTILTIFTGFLGITGVVSGTTDAAALKMTRAAISTVVPVVGKIMSDASEAVLISAAMAKNAVGIYGIYAILAVFLGPFVRIGIHYIIFRLTAEISFVIGTKRISAFVEDTSTVMSLILAATGSMCLLLLISCICFLKGVG